MSNPLLRAVAVPALALLVVTGCGDKKPAGKEPNAAQLVAAGLTALNQGDDKAATSAFQEAAQKDPKNFYAHYNLGTLAQKQGDDTTALREYGLALSINPSYVPALYNSATIYGKTNPQLAITTYQQVIKLQPKAPTAYLNLGLLEAKLHLWAQAGKDLDTALKQDGTLTSSIPKDVFKESPKPKPATSPS